MRVNRVPVVKPRIPVVAGGYYEQAGSPMFLARFEDNAGSNDYVFINVVTGKPVTRFMSLQDVEGAINDGSFVYDKDAEVTTSRPR